MDVQHIVYFSLDIAMKKVVLTEGRRHTLWTTKNGAMWTMRLGEVLYCERELENPDEFAVAMKLQNYLKTTVGHTIKYVAVQICMAFYLT